MKITVIEKSKIDWFGIVIFSLLGLYIITGIFRCIKRLKEPEADQQLVINGLIKFDMTTHSISIMKLYIVAFLIISLIVAIANK